MNKEDIKILSGFEDFITPLTDEEFSNLEENILEHGCKDPLVVWNKTSEESILIDGHNRYKICTKHKIPYQVRKLDFENEQEAKYWMINNQIGRRNLNSDELSYYRGLKYHLNKQNRGGYSSVMKKGTSSVSTSERLAKEFMVSEKTIKRDEKFYLGLNSIARENLSIRNDVLKGEIKIPKKKIMKLSDIQVPDFIKFEDRNEIVRKINMLLNPKPLNEPEETSLDTFIESGNLNFQDRINNFKGSILSSLNKYISSKEEKDFENVIKNLDRLKNYFGTHPEQKK